MILSIILYVFAFIGFIEIKQEPISDDTVQGETVEHLRGLITNLRSYLIEGDLEVDEDLYNQGIERGIKETEKLIKSLTKNKE